MHTPNRAIRTEAIRWLCTIAAVVLLAAACVCSTMLLYGGGSWATAAELEASHLAGVEVRELVGTTAYLRSDTPDAPTLWQAAARVLHLPLADPVQMLGAQLPQPAQSRSPSPNQASLLAPIDAWESGTDHIVLGWIPYNTASRTIQMMKDNPDVNVISPGWLTLTSAKGDLRNRAQNTVVQYAHDHHTSVWAMFDNQFDAALTHAVLADDSVRRRVVQQVAAAVRQDGLDGVNVDFENVRTDDRDRFTQFIQELHAALTPMHAVLSVDVTPDIAFLRDDAAFFHAGLAASCDYVVLMAYDEHWGGDPDPGPVADVPWVTQAVDDLLGTGVPAGKILLGLPFYTEFWHRHRDGTVTSTPVATPNIQPALQRQHAKSTWDDALGVAYARYPADDGYVEVWYETDETMQRKLALVSDRGLAGVAIWSLALSDQQTGSGLAEALRQALS
ncbi:glycosyl hydrolase family 18 protein [Alicyclobacillus macrosporangiidus]|uniref:Spore germination protein YaaH n=1 Tax=Alicyclobacillus macrosporangiidus TaxID=392015 RepID=A0A1I7KN23_9BACL|nr:glycosyl hydrolase family 18 protein [Alicyclobacillus macrosporangiidus]SFU98847.1 Spore germination protein YaaH [Alicyclobacillus macrosporangiidus]